MRELDSSDAIEYTFFGDPKHIEGIKPADSTVVKRFVPLSYTRLRQFFWQPSAIRLALLEDWDVIVFLGNPNFLATWIAATISRLRGIPVLFWEHGWRRKEAWLKAKFRMTFFRLANRMLVYSPRAKILGIDAGYPADRIDVVWNSLDTNTADQLFYLIDSGALTDIRAANLFGNNDPVIICTARITENCRFDLLIEAAANLRSRGKLFNVLLIGDGPAIGSLRDLADYLSQPVHFYGSCYDEKIIAQLIYSSDITVSPGKVGLTAMHSLMYGTPVITHDNDDEQMPEVEAIRDGRTGARFSQNSSSDLARVIESWLAEMPSRSSVRQVCREEIARHWNPTLQAQIIDLAVMSVAGKNE